MGKEAHARTHEVCPLPTNPRAHTHAFLWGSSSPDTHTRTHSQAAPRTGGFSSRFLSIMCTRPLRWGGMGRCRVTCALRFLLCGARARVRRPLIMYGPVCMYAPERSLATSHISISMTTYNTLHVYVCIHITWNAVRRGIRCRFDIIEPKLLMKVKQ